MSSDFLRRLKGSEDEFEVRRMLKAFVDARGSKFEARFTAYRSTGGAAPGPAERGAFGFDFSSSGALPASVSHRLEVYDWGTFGASKSGWSKPVVSQCAADGRHRVRQVDARRRNHNAARAAAEGGVQQGCWCRGPRANATFVRARSLQVRARRVGCDRRPVALRDKDTYSVLLARFVNEGLNQVVTMAQVFWLKDLEGQPARLYVVADTSLTITEDFAGFGTDINQLRKRVRKAGHVVEDTFPPYAAAFRRRLGIDNEQALDLFTRRSR